MKIVKMRSGLYSVIGRDGFYKIVNVSAEKANMYFDAMIKRKKQFEQY
jgi:hypothetical protein